MKCYWPLCYGPNSVPNHEKNCECEPLCRCQNLLPEGATATEEDFYSRVRPNYDKRDLDHACYCSPARGLDACDPIFGGLFEYNSSYEDCPLYKAPEETEDELVNLFS